MILEEQKAADERILREQNFLTPQRHPRQDEFDLTQAALYNEFERADAQFTEAGRHLRKARAQCNTARRLRAEAEMRFRQRVAKQY